MLPVDEDENGTYIMNSKDLCAIELLDQMKNAGINGFKIEGRTKSLYYLSIITRAYRHAIDDLYAGKTFDEKWIKEVHSVANREYITGFLERNPGQRGENFRNTHLKNQTHQFCGIVTNIKADEKKVQIAVRNRFETGDQLEVISPHDSFLFTVSEIFSKTGDLLRCAHGGGEDVILRIPGPVSEFSIIRKPKNNKCRF
jgi:putative protease